MKRAKTEQIKSAVTQYMRRRNYLESEIQGGRPQGISLEEMSVKKRCRLSTGMENSIACSSISGDFNSCDQQFARLRKFVLESNPQQNEELSALLFPVFVHMYCNLLAAGIKPSAHKFHERHTEVFHLEEQKDFVRNLRKMDSKVELLAAKDISEFREHRYTVRLSHSSITHLLTHLKAADNMLVLQIINQNISLVGTDTKGKSLELQSDPSSSRTTGSSSSSTTPTTPTPNTTTTPTTNTTNNTNTTATTTTTTAATTTTAKEEKDGKKETKKKEVKEVKFARRAVNEDQLVVEEEEEEEEEEEVDWSGLSAEDKEEVEKFLEACRAMEALPPPLPSILFYSVINSSAHQGLCTSTISPDCQLLSGGFEDSAIQLYRLQPPPFPPLPSPDDCADASLTLAADHLCKEESERHLTVDMGSEESVTLRGHNGPVFKTEFTPDSLFLLSCSRDSTVRLWDVARRANLAVFRGHSGSVWDLSYNYRTNHFATSSRDLTIKLWDLELGYPLRSFVGHEQDIESVLIHPNGYYVASGSADKTVRLWDIRDGKCIRTLHGHRGSILALAFSADGGILASAGDDRRIHIWDLNTGTLTKELRGHTDTVYSLAYSPCDKMLASGGQDGFLRLWDLSAASSSSSSSSQQQSVSSAPAQTEGHTSSELMGAYSTKSATITSLSFPHFHLLHAVGACQ